MSLYRRWYAEADGGRDYRWHYDFRVRGRRHAGSTGLRDKALARKFEEQKRADAMLGRALEPGAAPALPRFDVYAQGYLDGDGKLKRSAASDRSAILRALTPYFGTLPIGDITRADVEQFRNDRLAGKLYRKPKPPAEGEGPKHDPHASRRPVPKPATVKNELALLRRILNVAIEAGILDRNPATGVRLPAFDNRRSRVIDREECARLLLAVNEAGAYLRPMIVLGYETGMRQGEIRGLRWVDVDLTRHVLRLGWTKNSEQRTVPLSEPAEAALRAWKRGDSTYVFPAVRGRMGHLGDVSHAFADLAARAGVQGVRFHDLRHTFCTRKVEAGADLITLASVTGHKTLDMLKRYSHPSEARRLEMVRGPAEKPARGSHTYSQRRPRAVRRAAVTC